jgi:hypothetical protein
MRSVADKPCKENTHTEKKQKHSMISNSYKIKTYWNIFTKLVATVV